MQITRERGNSSQYLSSSGRFCDSTCGESSASPTNVFSIRLERIKGYFRGVFCLSSVAIKLSAFVPEIS
jgi:hypothetical protein